MQNISLNIIPGGPEPLVYCSQGDVGRVFTITLYDDTGLYTIPNGATIKIIGKKNNGVMFKQSDVITSGSVVTVSLKSDMTDIKGLTECEVVIQDGQDIIGTANFVLFVEGGINDGTIAATDYIYDVKLTEDNTSSFVKPSDIKITSLDEDLLYAALLEKGADDSFRGLFQSMDGLKSLNLSTWNVEDYTTFANMFKDCSSLETLDMHGLSINGNMSQMCMGCRSLTLIDLSEASVKTNNLMATFSQCYNLTYIDTSGWDVSECEDFYGLFEDCRSLTSLDFSGWDTSNATSMSSMFDGCWNLRKMWVPSSFITTSIEDDIEKPFNAGTGRSQKTHIYTDASSAAAQGWGTIHSDYVVHYSTSYQDFLSA